MDYLSHNIGVNLNRIRRSKGMSLDVVAEQTGVSKSMLAQIEKGDSNPSIGTLGKIISGLRISFDDLIDTPPQDTFLVKVKSTIPTKEMPGQYKVWTCFPIEDNNMVEIYRIDIEPGGAYVSGSHGERTREYISIREGELLIELKEGSHLVTRDDVFRFESDREHRYVNAGSKTVSFMTFFVVY
ncbi:MAG: helix-turn-helix domain-containing protein [Lachnospiraceae bacterium]